MLLDVHLPDGGGVAVLEGLLEERLTRLAPRARDVVVWAAGVRASAVLPALSELERCGYRYYLERVLGLAERRSSASTDEPRSGEVQDGLDDLAHVRPCPGVRELVRFVDEGFDPRHPFAELLVFNEIGHQSLHSRGERGV